MTRTAVVTVVSGRHGHLRAQQAALARCRPAADLVVVVAMGDPSVEELVACGPTRDVAVVVPMPTGTGGLPLARARNLGVRTAMAAGADLLVLLDVDCLPVRGLLGRYAAAATGPARGDLLCGPVAYLPPLPAGRTAYDPATLAAARPHAARPAPADGDVVRGGDPTLFWSLSFAVHRSTWERVGGFDEAYAGYGAEDTDFGQRAQREGVSLAWVGGASSHHQWHPVSDPPVEHLEDVVRNANLFARRWGWFPMEGWLAAFEEQGLAARHGDQWVVTPRSCPNDGGRHRISGGGPCASAPVVGGLGSDEHEEQHEDDEDERDDGDGTGVQGPSRGCVAGRGGRRWCDASSDAGSRVSP
jgi:hypothetical protein